MTRAALRVVYFVANYASLTGSQRSLLAFLRSVDPGALRASVVFPGEGRCVDAYREAGVRVEVLPAPPRLDRFGGAIPRAGLAEQAAMVAVDLTPYAARFARLLARETADVAHFNDLRALLLAGPGALLRPTPRVWHLRGDARGVGRRHQLAGAALAHRIVCVADAVRETLPSWARKRARTVYNGIDAELGAIGRSRGALLDAVDAARGEPPERAAVRGDELVVLMVGTLVPFKGAHHLVEAAARIEARDPSLAARLRLILVGDAPLPAYRAQLAAQVASLRDVRVHFAGWDPAPLDWMRAADVVVLPTVARETLVVEGTAMVVEGTEGFPRTVLEAMACARPVVATRVMGTPEQVDDGVTGFLCRPSDAGGLAASIERVLRMTAEERERMGAAGRARVTERFSIQSNVEGTLAVYREMVARR